MILCERSDTNCNEFKFVSNKEAIGRYWKKYFVKSCIYYYDCQGCDKIPLGLSDFPNTLQLVLMKQLPVKILKGTYFLATILADAN